MANGFVNVRVSRDEYLEKSTDDKLVCLWDAMSDIQGRVEALGKWWLLKVSTMLLCSCIGGAVMTLVIHFFGIKPLGG